jgi:hypothetical protein
LNPSWVVCSKSAWELWGLVLSLWSSVKDTQFTGHLTWRMATSGMLTSWLK